MIDGISAETLLADRGYDTNQIIAYAADAGMNIVIPAKRNRKQQREYDRYLYRLRHLVENAFLHLKRWRGIATRYAKTTTSFRAAVQIRCIAIWFKFHTTGVNQKNNCIKIPNKFVKSGTSVDSADVNLVKLIINAYAATIIYKICNMFG